MATRWEREQEALAARRKVEGETREAAGILRHRAVQGTYAGLHGQDVGVNVAALLESLSRHLVDLPAPVLSDLSAVVRALRDGPDGPLDPQGKTFPPLSAGRGH